MARARPPKPPVNPIKPTPVVSQPLIPKQLVTLGLPPRPAPGTKPRHMEWRRWGSMEWKGTTTDPAIGNGTIQSWFRIEDARWLELWVEVVVGSTTTVGSGSWYFTGSPVPAAPPVPFSIVGWCGVYDSSGSAFYAGSVLLSDVGRVLPRMPDYSGADGAVTAVAAAAPITWATGDRLNVYAKFRYVE